MSSVDVAGRARTRDRFLPLELGLVLAWLYTALLGGTWANTSSFGVRLLSQLVMVVVLGLWLIVLARRREALPITPLDVPLLGFMVAFTLATVFSVDPRLSLEALILWAGYALLYYMLVALATTHTHMLLAVLIAVSSALATAAIAEVVVWYFGLAPGVGYSVSWPSVSLPGEILPPVRFRPNLVAGNPNLLAGYLAPLLPVAVALALCAESRAGRLAAWLWALALALALAATGSRGGFMAVAAGLAAFSALHLLPDRPAVVRVWLSDWRRLTLLSLLLSLMAAVAAWRVLPGMVARAGTEGVRVELWGHALAMLAQRPIFGFGPDTFGLALLQFRSPTARPEDLLPHAHNLYLGLAAELGLLGLGAALWIGIKVARAWWRTAQGAGPAKRMLVAGAMAGLAGTAAHSIVEDFRIFPLVVVQSIALVALVVGQAEGRIRTSAKHGLPARWLLAPCAIILAISALTTLTRWELDTGARLADAGRWMEAQGYLDAAASHDSALVFHALQSAVVGGRLAAEAGDDKTALAAAIESYSAAVAREPRYALHHANLATLLWQDEQRERAVAEMERAVALQPREPRYRLNLGRYYAAEGRSQDATREYASLVALEPAALHTLTGMEDFLPFGVGRDEIVQEVWAEMAVDPPFIRALRRAELALFSGEPTEAAVQLRRAIELDASSAFAWHRLGIALAQFGQPVAAEEAQRQSIALDHGNSAAHSALAALLAERGDLRGAEREAQLGLFLARDTSAELVLARLARQEGRVDEAIAHYSASLPRAKSYVAYDLSVWRRLGTHKDDLPGLFTPGPVRQDAEVYRELATYLADQGRLDEAVAVYRGLLDYDPSVRGEVKLALEHLGRSL